MFLFFFVLLHVIKLASEVKIVIAIEVGKSHRYFDIFSNTSLSDQTYGLINLNVNDISKNGHLMSPEGVIHLHIK